VGTFPHTLLLSATYEPLACVPWHRAMQLWLGGRAELVEHYPGRVIRSVRADYLLPAVLRFERPRPKRKLSVRFSRRNVFARDRGRCQYCRSRLQWREATYDHVVPRSRGGRTAWENIVIACRPCNQRKGSRSPEQSGMRLMRPPMRPRSLPAVDFGLVWRNGMPAIWQAYLRQSAKAAAANG